MITPVDTFPDSPIAENWVFSPTHIEPFFGAVDVTTLQAIAEEAILDIWTKAGPGSYGFFDHRYSYEINAAFAAADALEAVVVGLKRLASPMAVVDDGAQRVWRSALYAPELMAAFEREGIIPTVVAHPGSSDPASQALSVAHHFVVTTLGGIGAVPMTDVLNLREATGTERAAVSELADDVAETARRSDAAQESVVKAGAAELQLQYGRYVDALEEAGLRSVLRDLAPHASAVALATPVLFIGVASEFIAVQIATAASLQLALKAAFTKAARERRAEAMPQSTAFHWLYEASKRQGLD